MKNYYNWILLVGIVTTLAEAITVTSLQSKWKEIDILKRYFLMGVPFSAMASAALVWKFLIKKESIESLFNRAQNLYNNVNDRYGKSILLKYALLKGQDEYALLSCVESVESQKIFSIENELYQFNKMRKQLHARSGQGRGSSLLIADIHKLLFLMNDLAHKMEKINSFCKNNKIYFESYKKVENIAKTYQVIRKDSIDINLIKQFVLLENPRRKTLYPYTTFAQQLERDRDSLSYIMGKIKKYSQLYKNALGLDQELATILVAIYSFPEYSFECYYKLEKDRIFAEREKAEAIMHHAMAIAKQTQTQAQQEHTITLRPPAHVVSKTHHSPAGL